MALVQEQTGLAALQVEVNSIAYHLRSSWIRHALTDPCLFHATLYTASAEMDAMRGTQGTTTNYATLYHQTNTIRLLNRRLVHGGLMDDATIASVLLLVISGVRFRLTGPIPILHRDTVAQVPVDI